MRGEYRTKKDAPGRRRNHVPGRQIQQPKDRRNDDNGNP